MLPTYKAAVPEQQLLQLDHLADMLGDKVLHAKCKPWVGGSILLALQR